MKGMGDVESFHHIFIQLLLLLAVSISVIAIAKKLDQPYSIALVLVGLALGSTEEFAILEESEQFITQSEVFHVIVVSLFLPILLGDATLKMPFHELWDEKKSVFSLAFIGTLLSFLLIGFGGYFLLELPLIAAFTFAALMSATDPISVISIFKSLGVKKKMSIIMEGESLFNDGIAVVLFNISSIYLLTFLELGWEGLGQGVWMFVKFSVGGAIVGLIFGFIFSFIIRLFDDYPLEIALSAILFFGSYFTAEYLHVSGVIAVVVGGFVFFDYGAKIGMSEETRVNLNTFWDVITFIANSFIFLMVGLEIRNIHFAGKWWLIIGAILLVLAARAIALYGSTVWIKEISKNERLLLTWGGLRGSLSIALALSLSADFESRDLILILTFSVVLFSLIVQGISMKPVIRILGMIKK